MVKQKLVRLYKAEDVPDHIFQEVCDLVTKMSEAFTKVAQGHDDNIVLSAFNRFHAGLIIALVTESGLKDATQTEAIGLIKNVEHMSGKKIWEKKE